MALWLVRAGRFGEHEARFFTDNRVYLTWDGLDKDLAQAKDYQAIKAVVKETYPDEPKRRLGNWSGQIWAFVLQMKPGDLVVVPRKGKAAIAVGEISGPYTHDAKAETRYSHWREVRWCNTEVPRSAFDQDLLYSFGAIMTICEISRHDAEKRVRALIKAGFKLAEGQAKPASPLAAEGGDEFVDLERLGRDQIASLIIRKFKGHDMARLVEALLRAQGYTTYASPPGPDKGIDILAAPGPLGFGRPRICVQVKSQESPVDAPTLNQLIGAMQNVQAEQGLLVSWGGFKTSVDKETVAQFFRVRLWDQDSLIEQLLEHYDKLDDDLRAELPLKRIWTVASEEPEE